jgi:hypothetical protein
MQRSFLAILSFVVFLVFLAVIAVFGIVGMVIGAAVAPAIGRPFVFVPAIGPMPVEVVGLITGLALGFLTATLSCGAMFALIAIANNTRRTKEILLRGA